MANYKLFKCWEGEQGTVKQLSAEQWNNVTLQTLLTLRILQPFIL